MPGLPPCELLKATITVNVVVLTNDYSYQDRYAARHDETITLTVSFAAKNRERKTTWWLFGPGSLGPAQLELCDRA